MASVRFGNVDTVLHTRLKASAAAHRRSLEEEARELRRAAVARQETPLRENLGALARRLFGPEHGADLDLPPRDNTMGRSPPDFSGPEYDPPERPRSFSTPTLFQSWSRRSQNRPSLPTWTVLHPRPCSSRRSARPKFALASLACRAAGEGRN